MFNIYVKVFFILLFSSLVGPKKILERSLHLKYRNRDARNCPNHACVHPPDSCSSCVNYPNQNEVLEQPFYRNNVLENPFILVLLIILGLLFFLIFLGLLKALIGIISRKIGEFGLALLVDLPEPLEEYRESKLKCMVVKYDIAGWPIHPQTGERTVRVLPAKTEFCLNVIFFLAYPLALVLRICAICCCIRNYKGEEDDCFKEVNVVKYSEASTNKDKKSKGPQLDVYMEHDTREISDTQYVINMMRQSQISLGKYRNSDM